jgi:hypothetical protein
MGQSQYDYLRRMSEQLHKLDKDLRREKRGIKAIGVLGSDVFDKLLVLRPLRPQLPEAVFFTTDLDEAFTMGSEITWTRNLVVSSSFGLSLHKSIQREIPAFRGSYQTSAFLATLLAIGDPAKDWTTPSAVSDYISGQLLVSRIFEIERSGNVLSLAGDKLPLHVASPIIHGWNTRLARRILKNATHPDSLPILAASRRDVPQPNPRIKGSQIGIARKIRIKRTAAISSLPSASFSHGSRRAINAPWELALRSAP